MRTPVGDRGALPGPDGLEWTGCMPGGDAARRKPEHRMNLIEIFQNLVAQVPELLQPLIVALAGAVPFIEGEGAAAIGIVGGINPVLAAIAAVVGNFVCVAVLVLLGARTRGAIVAARGRSRQAAGGGANAVNAGTAGATAVSTLDP